MKFFTPKTLPGAIAPMITTNWIFGIGVIEYPMGRSRRMLSIFWSIVTFLIYLGFMSTANNSETLSHFRSKIAAHNFRISCDSSAVFIATALCLAHIETKTVKEILSKLNGMNDRLYVLGIPNDYELLFKTQIMQLAVTFTWIFIVIVVNAKYDDRSHLPASSRLGFVISIYYSLIFSVVVDFTFNVSIRYIGNRFRRLNEILAESHSPEKSGTRVARKSDNLIPHYPSVINEIDRTNSQAMRIADQRWLLYVIRESRKIHRNLCKTAMGLNRVFGIQVLLSVALSFSQVTTLLFVTYVIVVPSSPITSSHKNWLRPIITSMSAIVYASKIFVIVDACGSASCEATRTAELISTLLHTADNDEDIRDEINIFSLQLIQNPLNFTACGFFTLDYSLIREIMGSVATYLIIMIQMRSVYEPQVMNSAIPLQKNCTI